MTTVTAGKGDPDWWRGAVIYQVYPRSFQDTTGDGIGDIKGITRRLPYIASLGVDAIWLSPFFTSPMADMGYDVSDYCSVDPMFGNLSDFDEMMVECEKLGLKVIIDQVISHTSDQHPWFIESRSSRTNPRADWYVWADPKPDGTAPNNWLSIFGGPGWEWDGVRKQYYMHNFLTSQPDLNFHNPDVQKAVLATVKFWLDRGVHGFRLDTVNYYFHDRELRNNPPMVYDADSTGLETDTNPYSMQNHLHDKSQPENIEFLKKLRSLLDEYDCRTTVGEVGDGDRSLTTLSIYTSGNDKLHMCYTFDLLSPRFTADHIRGVVSKCQEIVTNGWVCWAFSNHDVVRHVTRFMETPDERERVAKLAISVLASLRGSICLYQGEELGLEEAELQFEDLRDPYGIRFWPAFKGRDGCRTPMVWQAQAPHGGFSPGGRTWLPVSPAHAKLAVDAQEADATSVLHHYRETLAFRRAHSCLFDGDLTFLETQADLLAFVREKGDERLLFVFNLTREAQDFLLPAQLSEAVPLPMPGFSPPVEDKVVRLAALDAFCARL